MTFAQRLRHPAGNHDGGRFAPVWSGSWEIPKATDILPKTRTGYATVPAAPSYASMATLAAVLQNKAEIEYAEALERVSEENEAFCLKRPTLPAFTSMEKGVRKVSEFATAYPTLATKEDVESLLDGLYAGWLEQSKDGFHNDALEDLTLMGVFPTDDGTLVPSTPPHPLVADWLARRYLGYGERYGKTFVQAVESRNQHFFRIFSAPTLSRSALEAAMRVCLPNSVTKQVAKDGNFNYICWYSGLQHPQVTAAFLSEIYYTAEPEVQYQCLTHREATAEMLLNGCLSSDPGLRAAALGNPKCPEEGRVAAALRKD